ncbi:MAG: heparinase II/III family protein [Gammaproteobacteria bacterium]
MPATLLSPFLVFVLIWIPEINHYYVATPSLSDELVADLRHIPSDLGLDEVNASSLILGFNYAEDGMQAARLSDEILAGKLALHGYPTAAVTPSFSAADLDQASPTLSLHVASLIVPDILLAAYAATGKQRYFDAAREYVVRFSQFERETWLSNDFLWNDHAIAARVFVLSRFWRQYRSHSSYDPHTAKMLMQAVARHAEFLAKPGHFTFATNHGVMQNLALLQLCVAFPELPGTSRYQKLVVKRLTDQLKFYVSPEGVVLEHSAGYHAVGVMLLREIFKRMRTLSLAVPSEWREKYAKAIDFLAQIKRPDGSLPRFGNTTGGATDTPQLADFKLREETEGFKTYGGQARSRSSFIAAISGYSVWWDKFQDKARPNNLAQTVIAWSRFPGHGHKHADEMSVLLWAHGQDWWTNVGYWPYGDELYEQAQSWQGSNAPHRVDEPKNSERDTRVLYQGWSDDLAFLELQRAGPDGYRARRQIMQLMGDTWLIIDEVADPTDHHSRVVWTASPNITVEPTGVKHGYRLRGSRSHTALDLSIRGSDGVTVDRVTGSRTPFAGWVADFNDIRKAPAFSIEMPAKAWTASVWKLVPGTASNLEVNYRMARWENSSNWEMELPLPQGLITLRRDSEKLILDGKDSNRIELALQHGADVRQQVKALYKHFASVAHAYEPFRDLRSYREKISYAILLLLMLQEVFFFGHRRVFGTSGVSREALRALVLLCWSGLGIWLPLIYLTYS